VELAGDLGNLRIGEPRLTAFRDLGNASFADARWELWGPDSDEPMATPAGSFLVGSDEDGQAILLAAFFPARAATRAVPTEVLRQDCGMSQMGAIGLNSRNQRFS
jgi:hypothetical protein